MKDIRITILALSLMLCGCASIPKTSAEWATLYVTEAKAAVEKGDRGTAVRKITKALGLPTGASQVKQLFASTPKARDLYFSALETTITEISSPSAALTAQDGIDNARIADIFLPAQISSLEASISKRVQVGNESGAIAFDLSNDVSKFPILASSAQRKILAARTIEILQSDKQRTMQIDALMRYIAERGRLSEEGRKVEAILHSFKIRRGEIEAVSTVFPEYGMLRRSEVTAQVVLQVKNGDRLLTEDLVQTLKARVRGVEWMSSPSGRSIYLVVERIRADEKVIPERTETVTYAQHEVNLLSAALFMPRNASFIYEVSSGGAEIEFGFAVTATFDQRVVHDELVRGRVGGEFRRCQNARVQNVFGGITSAGFVANDDMQRRCSGPTSVAIDELRRDVLTRLADSILKIPQIKAIDDLN